MNRYYYFVSKAGHVFKGYAIFADGVKDVRAKAKSAGLMDAMCSIYAINTDQIKPYGLVVL